MVITAGRTLALRFNPKGRYLRSFVAPESLFIDIMMNVPIIFLAARETGDPALFELAAAHCRTTERTLVRPDGGTAHEGIFDLQTGEFLRQTTHQGLRGDSDWTRGLAWSLYGYATVFRFTADPADLAVAERNADHYLARCPEGLIPPWDFDVPPGPDRIDDSSAAAIAASGLWDLAQIASTPDKAQRYRAAALTILDSLCDDRYLAWNTPGWEGVLMHGVYHFHKKLGVDESVMWGDFFFLEAVAKVLGVRPCARRAWEVGQPGWGLPRVDLGSPGRSAFNVATLADDTRHSSRLTARGPTSLVDGDVDHPHRQSDELPRPIPAAIRVRAPARVRRLRVVQRQGPRPVRARLT